VEIQAAILCDFAQVREGMLFVSSGGISRLYRPDQPMPLGIWLAVVLEVTADEMFAVHELRVTVSGEDGATVGSVTAGMQAPAGMQVQLNPGEPAVIPVVIPLMPIVVPGHGMYDIRIVADNGVAEIRTLYVGDPPQMGPPDS
jgi:hypothetical protein